MKMISDHYLSHSMDRRYKEFITRREFINRTGIFITEEYFVNIYDEFRKTTKSIDEFVSEYGSSIGDRVVEIAMPTVFRYALADKRISRGGDENFTFHDNGVTAYEVIDALVNDYNRKEKALDELSAIYWEVVCRYVEDQSAPAEVLESIKDSIKEYCLESDIYNDLYQESKKLKVKEVSYDENQKLNRVVLTHEDRLNDCMCNDFVEPEPEWV